MNTSAHFKGGLVAGLAAAGLAAASGAVPMGSLPIEGLPFGADALARLPGDIHVPGGLATLGAVALTAGLMALFPDLDVASRPQRWFYRGLLGALAALYLAGVAGELLAGLALVALLPLVHKHRGWTHWPLTPWLLALLAAVAHETLRARGAWIGGFAWANVAALLRSHWPFVAACVIGHHTHLLLDARFFRQPLRLARRR
jgi:hypothetical protein